MSSKPKIAVIVGSTRPTNLPTYRHMDLKQAQARGDLHVELVDLRNHPMPFFDEIASNMWMPSPDPEAIRWQKTVGRFDGYIFVVAEYNHSVTGVLKNALDQAYKEWNRKPFTAVGTARRRGARHRTSAIHRRGAAYGVDSRRGAYRRRRFHGGAPHVR